MLAMIRLGFYTENYVAGGSERYLADLMMGLDPNRYETILLSNPNPVFNRYLEQRGAHTFPHRIIPIVPPTPRLALRATAKQASQIPGDLATLKTVPGESLKAITNGLWRYATAVPNMALLTRVFRSLHLDIIHINNGGYPAAETCRLAVLAASLAKIPVCVMTVHSPAAPVVWPYALDHILDQQVAARTKKIVTMSESTALSLQKTRGMPPQKIFSMDLGIPLDLYATMSPSCDVRAQFGIPATATVIGIVGRFDWFKGHRDLLQVASKMIHSVHRDDLYFLLVGDGDEAPRMKTLAQNLGLKDRAIFTGFYPDASAAMRASDIMTMLSSGNEGQGYVILEAMAQARPVIATNVCGLKEVVVDGVTGLLVPPSDPESLANAIQQLISNPRLREAMGTAGRRRVEERFGLSRMVTETESLYQSLGYGEGKC